jgi:jumonji domain-containing protein 7
LYNHLDGTTSLVFAKPHEEEQPFSQFLDYLIKQEKQQQLPSSPQEVRYAQTQNDNLRNEYSILYPSVPKTSPWARVALGANDADAVNMWIGGGRSVTALHRDNYENVYVQIAGQKHFVLLPPACVAAVNEVELRPAKYRRRVRSEYRQDGDGELELELEDGPSVPFAIWDPDKPAENATKYSHLAKPVRVTLNPGDMLYLPAMWCVLPD